MAIYQWLCLSRSLYVCKLAGAEEGVHAHTLSSETSLNNIVILKPKGIQIPEEAS